MSDTTIKPCPFCGFRKPRVVESKQDQRYRVKCDCGAAGKPCKTERLAVVNWNNRNGGNGGSREPDETRPAAIHVRQLSRIKSR
jgi:hypothetical protein